MIATASVDSTSLFEDELCRYAEVSDCNHQHRAVLSTRARVTAPITKHKSDTITVYPRDGSVFWQYKVICCCQNKRFRLFSAELIEQLTVMAD